MNGDHDAIAKLVYTYAERLDGGDFEAAAVLFERATLRSTSNASVYRGSAEVLVVWRSTVMTYDGSPSTKHVTTNLMIDVDAGGSTATARSYFSVLQARPDLPLQVIVAGRYHDCFVKNDGAWRFDDRLIHVDLVGDVSRHLRRPIRA